MQNKLFVRLIVIITVLYTLYTFISEHCHDTSFTFDDMQRDDKIQQDDDWDTVSEGLYILFLSYKFL